MPLVVGQTEKPNNFALDCKHVFKNIKEGMGFKIFPQPRSALCVGVGVMRGGEVLASPSVPLLRS